MVAVERRFGVPAASPKQSLALQSPTGHWAASLWLYGLVMQGRWVVALGIKLHPTPIDVAESGRRKRPHSTHQPVV